MDEHLEVIEAVRELQQSNATMISDMVALRSATATAQADVLRAVNAATFAAGRCVVIEKKLNDVHRDIKLLLKQGSNGHG